MTVYVCYSEMFGGYHITDVECPHCTAAGCHCEDDWGHDITYVFDHDERAKARFGLPDMLTDGVQKMQWETPLRAEAYRPGSPAGQRRRP